MSCRVCGDATESRCTDNHATIYRPRTRRLLAECAAMLESHAREAPPPIFFSPSRCSGLAVGGKKRPTRNRRTGASYRVHGAPIFLSRVERLSRLPVSDWPSLPVRIRATAPRDRLVFLLYLVRRSAGNGCVVAGEKNRRTCAERFGEGDACIPSPRSGENRRRVTERRFFFLVPRRVCNGSRHESGTIFPEAEPGSD